MDAADVETLVDITATSELAKTRRDSLSEDL
jgi:hypothetical protein